MLTRSTLLVVLAALLCLTQTNAFNFKHHGLASSLAARDATDEGKGVKQDDLASLVGQSDSRLASPGKRPTAADQYNFNLSKGTLFAWKSKTPHNDADASSVVIAMHGVDRNAGDYFKNINDAYLKARSANMPYADTNTIRIAPLFFLTNSDKNALNDTTLAWGPDNDWAMGSGTTHPDGSDFSSLSVFDEIIDFYSNRAAYPNVKMITLVGHGGGALVFQRYAALRIKSDSRNVVPVRYVIGNPSTMLYFTNDRPSPVDSNKCDYYNAYYYGMDGYFIPYGADVDDVGQLFKEYAARDVRYLVSLGDTSAQNGDQSCGARAMGGSARKDRTLSYWKYINLLANGAGRQQVDSLSSYPGAFASMQSGSSSLSQFRTSTFKHQISKISGTGHDAGPVMASKQGLNAIFGN